MKNTFASNAFASKTFASGTWRGTGRDVAQYGGMTYRRVAETETPLPRPGLDTGPDYRRPSYSDGLLPRR